MGFVGIVLVPFGDARCDRTCAGIPRIVTLHSCIPSAKHTESGAFKTSIGRFIYIVCGTAGQLHRGARHAQPEHTAVYRGAAPTSRTPRIIPEMVLNYSRSALEIYVGSL